MNTPSKAIRSPFSAFPLSPPGGSASVLTEPHSPFRLTGRKRSTGDSELSHTPQRPGQAGIGLEDRFIPNRAKQDDELSYYLLTADDSSSATTCCNSPSKKVSLSQAKLKAELCNLTPTGGKRLMDCRQSIAPPCQSPSVFRKSISPVPAKAPARVIPELPKKTLDIPNLVNDYYLNLLHWGSADLLAIALGPTAYIWHPDSGQVDSALTLDDPSAYVSSLQWAPGGRQLAAGTSTNSTLLYDLHTESILRELDGQQTNRISSLSWASDHLLSAGSRDSSIVNYDLRMPHPAVFTYTGHAQEVCGLAWSADGNTLASGGNDNVLCIWDARMSSAGSPAYEPRLRLTDHSAAVKAVAWCPWQRNTLASGGGTADRCIRIWNTATGENIKCVDTGSQVCAIQWADHHKELVSSHGFSDYQLIVWRYSDMTKLQELRGHTKRVLNLAKSPCGKTICSASEDETLRFWDIFESPSGGGFSGSPIRSAAKSPYRPPALGSMIVR